MRRDVGNVRVRIVLARIPEIGAVAKASTQEPTDIAFALMTTDRRVSEPTAAKPARGAPCPAAIRAITALAAIAITASATSVALAGPAAAATITVSPADRIDTAEGFCTIGYPYDGTDGHTYAITAGHCATHTGQRVTDTDTGAVGTFVRADVDDDHRGGADYGLIDFGKHALALGFVGNYPVADAHPTPRPGQPICHTGVSSGQQCGHVSDTYGPDQYLSSLAQHPR